jgi:hypothetical protein
MPSKDINVPNLEVRRTRASMTKSSKRGSGKLASNLNTPDSTATSRYKRPIPEKPLAVTEEMMDAERPRLVGEKQALLTKVTNRHDTLVCYNFVSFLASVVRHNLYRSESCFIWKTLL